MSTRKKMITMIAGALAALPRASMAQGAISIRVSTPPNASVIPLYYGIKAGLFKRAGLDIQYTKSSTGVSIASAVAGGAYDIGVSPTLSVIYAHVRSIPFRILAPTDEMAFDSEAGLVVPSTSSLRAPKDFIGRTIAVQGSNDINVLAMKAWMDQGGADAASVKFIELPQSASPAALAEGRVDGICVTPPYSTIATADGRAKLIANIYAAIAPKVMTGCYFATADWIERNHDAALRFAQTYAQSATYLNSHYEVGRDELPEFTGIDRAVVYRMRKLLHTGSIDLSHIQPTIDAAVKYQLIDRGFSAIELIAASSRP